MIWPNVPCSAWKHSYKLLYNSKYSLITYNCKLKKNDMLSVGKDASSHDLAIERRRYTRPKTDPDQRLCTHCYEIENEEHLITNCQINAQERQTFFTKVSSKSPTFIQFNDHDKFIYLMSCKDRQILAWFGKFLYKSFYIRNTKSHGSRIPSEQWSESRQQQVHKELPFY